MIVIIYRLLLPTEHFPNDYIEFRELAAAQAYAEEHYIFPPVIVPLPREVDED